MKTQWQDYRELELIPDSVPPPDIPQAPIVRWLYDNCQALYNNLTCSLSADQPVDYLEQCFQLDCDRSNQFPSFGELIWRFFTYPLGSKRSTASHKEPKIRQIQDREGQTWWQAYDPITGQTTYLSSEHEVQIWLEERLYF
jgi:hypothetical protein